jgi:hypothetical protein
MELSLKKYLSTALKWLTPFVFLELLICILYFTSITEAGLFAIINIVNIVCLLIPGAYFLIMFFVYKQKCKNFIPTEGVISNWQTGFYRYTESVIVKVDDKEDSTSSLWSKLRVII